VIAFVDRWSYVEKWGSAVGNVIFLDDIACTKLGKNCHRILRYEQDVGTLYVDIVVQGMYGRL